MSGKRVQSGAKDAAPALAPEPRHDTPSERSITMKDTASRVEPPAPWYSQCVPMHLTLRRGPSALRTVVYCTCGWEHTYGSRRKALKRITEHLALGRPGEAS